MKKLYTFIAAVLLAAGLLAQAPQSFKYQAVLRDGSGNIKVSTAVSIDISILQGSAGGSAVYSETHSTTTNAFGLVNLDLGSGTSTTGTFATIDWGADTYYVKVTVGGEDMGTSQLLSVPYALYAKTSETPGPKGDKGDQGIQGEQGIAGTDGKSAYQTWLDAGNTGTEADFVASLGGIQGAKGEKGDQGDKGDKGEQGIQGVQGVQGEQGIQGMAGASGMSGITYKGNYEAATTYVERDCARSLVNGNAYYCKVASATGKEPSANPAEWDLFVMEGATGMQGIAGAKGDQGDAGIQGIQGLKGDKGDTGLTGSAGANGADGLTTSVNGVTQVAGAITLTKADLGLANVDNTSDITKPIGTATQNALDLKANTASLATVATTGSYASLSDTPNLSAYLTTETDPVFNTSVAKNIKAADTTRWSNKLSSYTETDPAFTAWDKTTDISITESQISDLGTYVETESDPTVPSHVKAITSDNISNWNAANTHSSTTTGSVHGSTTVGGNLLRLANPSAITFPRFNADNTVSALSAADFRTAIGAGTGAGTLTGVSAGNGLDFTTITGTGSVTMGTPSILTNATTNGVTATSHTHAVTTVLPSSTSSGIMVASGTKTSGGFYGGTTAPTNTTRLNYDGYLYSTQIFEGANRVYSAGNTNIGTGATNYAVGNHSHTGMGTVTSVTGTSPISVATGTTTPVISLSTVPVTIGGTGTATAPTQGGVIFASSTSVYASTTAGTSGQVLTSNGTSAPTWTTVATTPAGVIQQYAGASAPTGYLLCQGQAVSRTTYAALFAVIGTTYGAGNGSTTFNLPDLQQRVAVGKHSTGTFNTLGSTGGAETHNITTTELPSHNHASGTLVTASNGTHAHTASTGTDGDHTHRIQRDDVALNMRWGDGTGNSDRYIDAAGGSGDYGAMLSATSAGAHTHTVTVNSDGIHTHTISGSTANAGSDSAIPIVQPYIVLNYIIKH